jgi:UDP-N-acetylglucosamine:LPS N-acetylglucosamine transferase
VEGEYGDYCEDPSKIAQEVGYWLKDSELLKTMSRAAQKAGHPYAADEIVHDIGAETVAWMALNAL